MDRDLIKSKLDAGWKHFKAGQYAEAAGLCRQALQADPEHGEAWYILGTALFRLNQFREAESSGRLSGSGRITCLPNFTWALCSLGWRSSMKPRAVSRRPSRSLRARQRGTTAWASPWLD